MCIFHLYTLHRAGDYSIGDDLWSSINSADLANLTEHVRVHVCMHVGVGGKYSVHNSSVGRESVCWFSSFEFISSP